MNSQKSTWTPVIGQSGEQAGLSASMEWWALLLLNAEISFVFQLFSHVSSSLVLFFKIKMYNVYTMYISATVYVLSNQTSCNPLVVKPLIFCLSTIHTYLFAIWPVLPLVYIHLTLCWYLESCTIIKNKSWFGFEPLTAKNVQMELVLANIIMTIWQLWSSEALKSVSLQVKVWVWSIIVVAFPVSPTSPFKISLSQPHLNNELPLPLVHWSQLGA